MDNVLYSTTMLAGIIQSLFRPPSFLLKNFFKQITQFESEKVAFDVEIKKRRVPAFVLPDGKGTQVSEVTFSTKEFTPGYVKEETKLDNLRAFSRAMGERIGGGQFSPLDRQMISLARTMLERQEAVVRGKEVQAMQALTTGTATFAGPGMPTNVVNFQRNSALTINNSGTSTWDNAASTPLDDIETWMLDVQLLEGAIITEVILDPVAWKAFYNNAQVKAIFEVRNFNPGTGQGLPVGPTLVDTDQGCVAYKGMIGTVRVWVYSESYIDNTGASQPLLPPGTVLGVAMPAGGIGQQLHGAIVDVEAGLAPVEFYAKSYVKQEEGRRFIQTQTSFLVALTRPNATFCATVLAA